MNLKTNNKRTQKGITLIALVVTIVVLLILAGVSLNAIFSENGLINRAKYAQNKMDQATQNDLDSINSLNEWIDGKINGNTGGESEAVTNPYDPNGWTMAYVCNDGTWSDTPLTSANGDTIPEGTQIVAKFYATGEKITPQAVEELGTTFQEGEAYKVVIEGTGKMGPLLTTSQNDDKITATGAGWQKQTATYLNWLIGGMQGDTVMLIMPYITEAIICDGITEIGDGAFGYETSLYKVFLPKTLINIGNEAFYTGSTKTTNLIVLNETEAKRVNSLNIVPDYARTIVVNEDSIAQNTINAAEVAKHPVVYCGKEVTGYTCDNSAGISKWKIYHSDGKNIYLIADNYITGEYIPIKDGATMTASTDYTNAYYFEDTLLNKYTGAASITDTNITPWLSYLKSSYGGSDNTNKNMKATAYLLDTEIWKGFKNSTKAKYAIGAPTLDMFVASYNTRFAKQIETIAQEIGYKLKFTDRDSYECSLDTYDYLTAHQYKENYVQGMWLASPSTIASGNLMEMSHDGGITNNGLNCSAVGVRPLVCLESGVSLEKQEVNGEIVYNIK